MKQEIEVEKVMQIDDQIARLKDVVGTISLRAQILGKRLAPLLREEITEPDTPVTITPPLVPLAAVLRDCVESINTTTVFVERILDRLEI